MLTSEGERDAKINEAEGDKQRVIKASEASKQQQINEAQGQAEAILAVATATAEGLRQVAAALRTEGGHEAMQLRVAEIVSRRIREAREGEHHVGGAGEPHRSRVDDLDATTVMRKTT